MLENVVFSWASYNSKENWHFVTKEEGEDY